MFGPLPSLHRLLLVVAVLLVTAGAGAWLAHLPITSIAVYVGAVAGVGVGAVLSFLLVHDFHATARPRPARRH